MEDPLIVCSLLFASKMSLSEFLYNSVIAQFKALLKVDPNKAQKLLEELHSLTKTPTPAPTSTLALTSVTSQTNSGKTSGEVEVKEMKHSKKTQATQAKVKNAEALVKARALLAERMKLVMCLRKYLMSILGVSKPIIYGSFVRKMFELILSPDIPDFGKGDIDICLSRHTFQRERLIKILNAIDLLRRQVMFIKRLPLF